MKKYEGNGEEDGEVPGGVKDDERQVEKSRSQETGESKDRVIFVETRSKVPRSFKISREDVEKYKATTGCPGCSALKRGMAYQPH
eukprot:7160645-Karenia_brevis.AAC.1